jgi:hypothetical protein
VPWSGIALGACLQNGLRDEVRLLVLVPATVDGRRLTGGVLRPQRLVLALQVVVDDGGGDSQDALRRPVILLEAHHARPREILLEIEDVGNIRTPPTVDRLVWIAHDADVAVLRGQQADDAVLRAVRVLVLVDQHVPPEAAIVRDDVRRVGEEPDDEQQEVVEIDRAGLLQAPFVARVHERGLLLPRPARVAQRLRHADHLVLEIGEAVAGRARGEGAVRQLPLLHALLQERGAVVLVVDREVPRQADVLPVLAQDADARRVERRDEGRPQPHRGEERLHPPRHLAGGLVGEGHRQDVP